MTVSDLEATQRWMMEALMAPGAAGKAADHLLPGGRLGAAACLAIYQRSYMMRLGKCLAEQFPATCHALGAPLFQAFARDYLRACPSDSYTLYDLGRRFAPWLEETRPDRDGDREDWIDFMVDLAGYERDLFRLFDAPGLEGSPWPTPRTEDAMLVLQPCLALAEYRYPVAWYYHEVRAGRGPHYPAAQRSPTVTLRRDYLTHTYPLGAEHYRLLQLIGRERGIRPALDALAGETGRRPGEIVRLWREDLRDGWIAAGFFALSPKDPPAD